MWMALGLLWCSREAGFGGRRTLRDSYAVVREMLSWSLREKLDIRQVLS